MKFIRNHYLWKERQRKQNLAREKSSCTTVLTKQWPTQWSKYCLSVFLYLVKTASLLCPASGSQMEGSHTWKGVTLGGAAFCNEDNPEGADSQKLSTDCTSCCPWAAKPSLKGGLEAHLQVYHT